MSHAHVKLKAWSRRSAAPTSRTTGRERSRDPRGVRRQQGVQVGPRRRRRDPEAVRRRARHDQGDVLAPAADPERDRAARRRRAAISGHGRVHALVGDADPAHPQDHDRTDARDPRDEAARDRPGRRRRLRLEAERLRGGGDRGRDRTQARQAGEVDRGAQRELPRDHPWPRRPPGDGARCERGGQGHRRPRAADRRLRRVLPARHAGIPLLGAFLYGGVYDIQGYFFECTGVFTNKTPTDAYRGAGRPEATYAIERAMDALARHVGKDTAEIRRLNFIPPFDATHEIAAGLALDSGNFEGTLDKALERADYEGLRREQEERRQRGDTKQLGIGLSSYIEMCGLAPSQVLAALKYGGGGGGAATVRCHPTGKVTVVTGSSP